MWKGARSPPPSPAPASSGTPCPSLPSLPCADAGKCPAVAAVLALAGATAWKDADGRSHEAFDCPHCQCLLPPPPPPHSLVIPLLPPNLVHTHPLVLAPAPKAKGRTERAIRDVWDCPRCLHGRLCVDHSCLRDRPGAGHGA